MPTKRRPEIEYVTVVEKHKDGRTKEYVRGRFLGKVFVEIESKEREKKKNRANDVVIHGDFILSVD